MILDVQERLFLYTHEVWKNVASVPCYQKYLPDMALYEVSTMGRFRKKNPLLPDGYQLLNPSASTTGSKGFPKYVCRFSLNGTRKNIYLNQLVLTVFDYREDIECLTVVNLNHNEADCRLCNLMWSDRITFGKQIMTFPAFYNLPTKSGEIWTHAMHCNIFAKFNITNMYVSSHGRVYSRPYAAPSKFLSQKIINSGYYAIAVPTVDHSYSNNILVHRLVLYSFNPIENAAIMQVNHKDGNKLNNYLDNLEWMTPKENTHDAILHDRMIMNYGENSSLANHSNQLVYNICSLFTSGHSVQDIRALYQFNSQITALIYNVCRANTRALNIYEFLINNGYTCSSLFTKEQLNEIIENAKENNSKELIDALPWITPYTPQHLAAMFITKNQIKDRIYYVKYLES